MNTLIDSNARRTAQQADQVRAALDSLGIKAPKATRDLIERADRADQVLPDLQEQARQADATANDAAQSGDMEALIAAVAHGRNLAAAFDIASSAVNATARASLRIQAVRAWARDAAAKVQENFEDAGAEFLTIYRDEFRSGPINLATVLDSDDVRDAWRRLKDAAATMDHARAILDFTAGYNAHDKAPRTLYVRNLAYLNTEAEQAKAAHPFGEWIAVPELRPVAHWLSDALRTPRPGEDIAFRFDPEQAEKDDQTFEQFLSLYANGANRPGGILTHNVAQAAQHYWKR